MATFIEHALYGGAMTVKLPQDYIDSSNLRQIPDHQEVFLSSTSLTSVIFEINQFVHQADDAATNYHFVDVISPPDHLEGSLSQPHRVTMSTNSLRQFPAYVIQGKILSPEVDRNAESSLPLDWQQNPQMKVLSTKVYQLVVRLEKFETDLCLRVNVPQKELTSEEQKNNEEGEASLILEKVIETLDIKDFELFG